MPMPRGIGLHPRGKCKVCKREFGLVEGKVREHGSCLGQGHFPLPRYRENIRHGVGQHNAHKPMHRECVNGMWQCAKCLKWLAADKFSYHKQHGDRPTGKVQISSYCKECQTVLRSKYPNYHLNTRKKRIAEGKCPHCGGKRRVLKFTECEQCRLKRRTQAQSRDITRKIEDAARRRHSNSPI